jgi:hypothetical protein
MAKLNGVTTVSERIQYNGAEYVKSDDAAVVGDIVRHDAEGYTSIPEGAYYEVLRANKAGEPKIIDEDGDEITVDSDFAVFKRVEEVVQPQYREVKRKAIVGERIRIVAAQYTSGRYQNGDEFTAMRLSDSGGVEFVTGKGEGGYAYQREYVVLEPVQADVKKAEDEPQPGDKVRSKMYPDTLHTLVKRLPQHDGDRYGKAWDITPGSWLGEKQFYIVERAVEAAKAAEEAKWSAIGRKVGEYKVGDIVRTTDSVGHKVGTIGVICTVDDTDMPRVKANGTAMWHTVELIAPVESLFNRSEA